MDRIPTSSGIYETELLAEALREGLEIVEVPVAVEERRASREVLGSKIIRKLEDLLSARLKSITIFVGTPFLIGGLLSLLNLTIGKLRSGATGGFVNPYSFLLSMLSVFFGFQILQNYVPTPKFQCHNRSRVEPDIHRNKQSTFKK